MTEAKSQLTQAMKKHSLSLSLILSNLSCVRMTKPMDTQTIADTKSAPPAFHSSKCSAATTQGSIKTPSIKVMMPSILMIDLKLTLISVYPVRIPVMPRKQRQHGEKLQPAHAHQHGTSILSKIRKERIIHRRTYQVEARAHVAQT